MLGRELTAEHHAYLVGEGIAAEYVDHRISLGLLRSVGDDGALPSGLDYDWLATENRTGILFGAVDAFGETHWQLRPDRPPVLGGEGRAVKYVSAAGAPESFVLQRSSTGPILLVEGTKQSLAAAAAVYGDCSDPDLLGGGVTVLGMHGCWGWSTGGIPDPGLVKLCAGREVAVALDADAGTNSRVYSAGIDLQDALRGVAKAVEFLWLPGRGKEGLDDLLAAMPEGDRRQALSAWYGARQPKPARKKPSDKTGQGSGGFEAWSADGKLQVEAVADYLIATRHYAMAQSGQLAAYVGGVYVVAPQQLASDVLDLLGDTFAVGHLNNIRAAVEARVFKLKRKLPQFPVEPYANFRNCLVDLRTLETLPHTPDFLGTRQVPVDWDPDAPADEWVAWATDRMGPDQLAAFEDVCCQVLDPSSFPTKSPILFGPTRSGKSTAGRVVAAISGGDGFVSGVPLQSLSDPRYAAMLYGMVLNSCTDLPREALADASGFYKSLGGDPIMADEKYGKVFTFVSGAMHFFATNNIPTLSGDVEPYLDRVLPLAFVKSYAGKSDQRREDRVLEQLPGICVRFAKAWQARYQRLQLRDEQAGAGVPEADRVAAWLPGHPAAVAWFADGSDRVRQFADAACEVGIERMPDIGMLREEGDAPAGPLTKTLLYASFLQWVEADGGKSMRMRGFIDRLMSLPGVREIRDPSTKKRLVNVGVKPREDWADGDASYASLLPLIFPDEFGGDSGGAAGGGPAGPQPMPEPGPFPPAPAQASAAAGPVPHIGTVGESRRPGPATDVPLEEGELVALRMLTPEAYESLAGVAVVAGAGQEPHLLVQRAPVALLLTDLAETVPMSVDRLRALIRRLDPLLYRAGWVIRERRLAEPGALGSAAAPGFGDKDFGADRVGYSVVRAAQAINPHTATRQEAA